MTILFQLALSISSLGLAIFLINYLCKDRRDPNIIELLKSTNLIFIPMIIISKKLKNVISEIKNLLLSNTEEDVVLGLVLLEDKYKELFIEEEPEGSTNYVKHFYFKREPLNEFIVLFDNYYYYSYIGKKDPGLYIWIDYRKEEDFHCKIYNYKTNNHEKTESS